MYRTVATRTRGTGSFSLRTASIEIWEDDVEVANTWGVDDYLGRVTVDLGAYGDGAVFTRRLTRDDWDYEITFELKIERFADPNPTADGDSDGDGILESAEARVARAFGGITDPRRKDILVEVDWMSGHGLNTRAKRQVITRFATRGYFAYIHRHRQIASDGCLTRTEARNLYNSNFSFAGYGGFRYAVMAAKLWNDASGVAIGDAFFVDDSTWWINGGVLPQAGTFIHELGHTLGLTQRIFRLIDTIAWLSYDSAMNYTYQATMVDYSDDGAGGDSNDHDDWAVVDPAYGLQYSFGLSTRNNDGVCN
jgi:hypothetical protein